MKGSIHNLDNSKYLNELRNLGMLTLCRRVLPKNVHVYETADTLQLKAGPYNLPCKAFHNCRYQREPLHTLLAFSLLGKSVTLS